MLKDYFSIRSIKFWLLYTLADVLGLLIGFYIFGYFYFTSEVNIKFYWNQVTEFLNYWYIIKLYLPIQFVAFIIFWRGKFLKRDFISVFRILVLIIHLGVIITSLRLGPEYILSQPVFWIGGLSVIILNALAFMIFENIK